MWPWIFFSEASSPEPPHAPPAKSTCRRRIRSRGFWLLVPGSVGVMWGQGGSGGAPRLPLVAREAPQPERSLALVSLGVAVWGALDYAPGLTFQPETNSAPQTVTELQKIGRGFWFVAPPLAFQFLQFQSNNYLPAIALDWKHVVRSFHPPAPNSCMTVVCVSQKEDPLRPMTSAKCLHL